MSVPMLSTETDNLIVSQTVHALKVTLQQTTRNEAFVINSGRFLKHTETDTDLTSWLWHVQPRSIRDMSRPPA
jgi:hypothetical protein